MSNSKKIENFKVASGIFSELKDTIVEVMKVNPDIVEDALRKRNTQIKCLRADIEHRQVVFKEISDRYDAAMDEADKLRADRDMYKSLYEKMKIEKETAETASLNSHKLFIEKQDDYLRMKKEKERLDKEIATLDDELNKSKTHLAIAAMEKKKSMSYKVHQLIDKIPNEFIKSIFNFLFSQTVYRYTLFFIFMLLLFTSIFTWTPIIELVKQIKSIF